MIRTMDSFTGTMVSLHIKNSVTLHDLNHDPNSEILSFYRCLSFTYHSICMSSVPLSGIDSAIFTHHLICHSVVFAYHSIDLYSISVSIAVWDRFCHFYTPFN